MWPPQPPQHGLLTTLAPEWEFLRQPRDVWTAANWRRWADLLDQAGHDMARELADARVRLWETQRRASRRPNPYLNPQPAKAASGTSALDIAKLMQGMFEPWAHGLGAATDTAARRGAAWPTGGLLGPSNRPKRGRPKGSQWADIARDADEVMAAAKRRGKRLTKLNAVNEAQRMRGRRPLSERESRTVRRLMRPLAGTTKRAR